MARRMMRSISEIRSGVSNRLLNVEPIFNEGYSRRKGVENSAFAQRGITIFEKEDAESLVDCAKGRRKDPDYICGRRKK